MIQLTENAIYLPLPIGAHSLHIIGDKLLYMYEAANMPLTLYGEAHIGYGYELLFTTSTIDEEKAKMVVETHSCVWEGETHSGYKDYEVHEVGSAGWHYDVSDWPFDHALPSFQSLLQSKSLDTKVNYAILKKV